MDARRLLAVDRINALLGAEELASLAEWCCLLCVPFDSWPAHSACLAFLDLAISRDVDAALRCGKARSRSAALSLVCGEMGMDGASVRRRWERTRRRGVR
jgi:hypothetical protein